jgi:hypothetical protein
MLLRRIGWHLRRVRGRIDRRTALGLVGLLVGTIPAAAAIVTVEEGCGSRARSWSRWCGTGRAR